VNLVIDTNVLLSFYSYSDDDLAELEKLIVCLEEAEVTLLLPRQVIDEFKRNRGSKINEALTKLKEGRPRRFNQVPRMAQAFDETRDTRRLSQELDAKWQDLYGRLEDQAREGSLKADHITTRIFEIVSAIEMTDEVFARAHRRHLLGNPPGKRDSIGDSIIWEALLQDAPSGEDLHLVSMDGDFSSDLSPTAAHEYLLKEWREVKGSALIFYSSLSEFFRAHFKDIRLAADLHREILVNRLRTSSSFQMTHTVIAQLRPLLPLPAEDAASILEAVCENSQIHSILQDADVKSLVRELLSVQADHASPETVGQVTYMLAGNSAIGWMMEKYSERMVREVPESAEA
jgi:hypothetical protein